LYEDADTFHTPTVTPGSVGVTAALFTSSPDFFSPDVNNYVFFPGDLNDEMMYVQANENTMYRLGESRTVNAGPRREP